MAQSMESKVRERTNAQKKLMEADNILDIHIAVYDGDEDYFNYKNDSRLSNVNAQTTKGWTPLMIACNMRGRTSIAVQLLRIGADVNLVNHEGWTARELAKFYKLTEILDLFASQL